LQDICIPMAKSYI